MKSKLILFLALIFSISLIFEGCESIKNTNQTQRGAAVGVASGAVLGGILGNNVGKGGKGALGAVVGGAVGGAVGGLIGNKMDKEAREIKEALPSAEVQRVGEGIHLLLGENSINFEFNKAVLTDKSKANLDKLVPVFKEYNDTNITIFGYTDSKGSDEYNLKLSEQRAKAVSGYLASKGIASSSLKNKGMGEVDPIADNETDAGRAQNRRVEFAITANEKMIEDAKKEAGQ